MALSNSTAGLARAHDTLDDLGVPRFGRDGGADDIDARIRALDDRKVRLAPSLPAPDHLEVARTALAGLSEFPVDPTVNGAADEVDDGIRTLCAVAQAAATIALTEEVRLLHKFFLTGRRGRKEAGNGRARQPAVVAL